MKSDYNKVLIILFVLGINSSFVPKIYRSFIKVEKLNTNLKILKEEKKDILKSINTYEEKKEKLNINYYKEEIARNYLKMVKPGEKIYKVIK